MAEHPVPIRRVHSPVATSHLASGEQSLSVLALLVDGDNRHATRFRDGLATVWCWNSGRDFLVDDIHRPHRDPTPAESRYPLSKSPH